MKIKVRVEGANDAHTTLRVFCNGASCGLLTATTEEAAQIIARLSTEPPEPCGKLYPAKSMFLRVSVGTANGDDGSEYELSSVGPHLPMVRSKKSGRFFSLSWDDVVALAMRAGVDEPGELCGSCEDPACEHPNEHRGSRS